MKNLIFIALLLMSILILGCWNSNNSSQETWSCKDVTSYDHNWNNDMKCTSSKGNVKYTSYEWARVLESL